MMQSGRTAAQDLEPRRWTLLPVGRTVVGIGYGQTVGDVFFDPVLLVENAEVEADSVILSYVRSFELADRSARFDALIPWQDARWSGLLQGEPAVVRRIGLADPRFRLSINLAGAPNPETAESRDNTVVGAALEVVIPVGEHLEDKLLNLGQNRFTIRPQMGFVHTRGPWSYELTGSVFLYSDNDEFFNGNRREQKPLYALQTHLVRMFRPGLWVSLSAGYGWGARSEVNDERKDDEKGDFLAGLAVGFPVGRNQGMKLAYIRTRTRKDTGADTDTLVLAWTMLY